MEQLENNPNSTGRYAPDNAVLFGICLVVGFGLFAGINSIAANSYIHLDQKPNVILILADDAGIGDFGFDQNSLIKTPNLDKLARQSTRFTNFYVSPVCAPTRSSLMTGKCSERTGIYDTYNGGAVMAANEITIAEILRRNGYQTGIFGKWHLGDNYPHRPMDKGFNQSFVFKGGGIGQPGDYDNYFAGDSSYFNPVIYQNEKKIKTNGYCTDVFTREAIKFIIRNKDTPFFTYLAYNVPHTPLQVPGNYYAMYKDLTLNDFKRFPANSSFRMNAKDLEAAKRVYGMISNMDDNIGKLLKVLEDQNLMDNTVIIFLSDNGPAQDRYRMGLRGRKTMVYEGGIRSPCLWHLPRVFPQNKEINTPVAHIDILPTVLDLCDIKKPETDAIDGRDMMPLLKGEDAEFKDRTLFFEWGRGFPIPYQNFAAMKGRYKLVGHSYQLNGLHGFELFDLQTNPEEYHNILNENEPVALELKQEMHDWYFKMVSDPDNRKVHPAVVGTKFENPVVLNRNDAKGSPDIWQQDEIFGYWDIQVADSGKYNVEVRFIREINDPGTLYLKLYPFQYANTSSGKINHMKIDNIYLSKGNYRLETYYQTKSGKCIFPLYASIEKLN